MRQKCLSKDKKKACLKAKKANDNKIVDNDKDTGPLSPAIVASPGPPAPVTTSFNLFAPVAASLDLLASVAASSDFLTSGSINLSLISAMGASIAVCPSLFSFPVRLFPFSFPAHHTTPISPSPM